MISYINFFRSLTFGGLLGAGIAGVLYFLFPQGFTRVYSLEIFIAFGGAAGAGFQQVIESLIKFILPPITAFISYYEKMVELAWLRSRGHITSKQYKMIMDELTARRFLGKESLKFPPSSTKVPARPIYIERFPNPDSPSED